MKFFFSRGRGGDRLRALGMGAVVGLLSLPGSCVPGLPTMVVIGVGVRGRKLVFGCQTDGSLRWQIRYYLVTMVVKIHAERNVLGDLFDGVARDMPVRA